MQALFSYSEPRRVINGMENSVGSVGQLSPAHDVVLMCEGCSMRVVRWKATIFGDIQHKHIQRMARAATLPNWDHALHTLQTMAKLMDAQDGESVRIDGCVLPKFAEWHGVVKGLKTACEMAPTDQQPSEVWLVLWKANMPMITPEFMYKVPWKKLVVCGQVGLVKHIDEACMWCGACKSMYHFVNSCPMMQHGCRALGGRRPHHCADKQECAYGGGCTSYGHYGANKGPWLARPAHPLQEGAKVIVFSIFSARFHHNAIGWHRKMMTETYYRVLLSC